MKRLIPIIAIIWFSSCKKFVPEIAETDETPVFTSVGKIDQQDVSFAADGKSFDAFAESDADSLGVLVHKSGLREANCTSCEDRIWVEVRSISMQNTDVVSALSQSQIAIRFVNKLDSILNYHIQLNPDFIGTPTQVSWSVASGNFTGIAPDFTVVASEFGTKLPINFNIDFSGGCQISGVDTIYLPSHLCDAQITSAMIDALTFEYTANGQFGAGYAYEWQFSNGATASAKNVKIYYPTPIIDKENAVLKLTNEHNSVTKRYARALTPNASCDMNLNYQVDEVYSYLLAGANVDFGQMVLRYQINGKVYSSESIEQPSGASFVVESIEDFTDPTVTERFFVKVSMNFNGLLSNGSETIEVKNLKLVLPFEI